MLLSMILCPVALFLYPDFSALLIITHGRETFFSTSDMKIRAERVTDK
jgi:hypothetical protein